MAATARRAGWIGSNILLNRVPESGKIHIVQNSIVRPKESVLAEWQKTLFFRSESPETRGWLLDVMNCVELLGKRDFTLDEVYAFERHLGDLYPGNQNVKPKIRQQLQYLRDRGFIDFVSRGQLSFAILGDFAWPGFSTSINATDASADGPTNGPACATTSARIAAARDMTPYHSEDLTDLVAQEGDEFIVLCRLRQRSTIPTTASLAASRRGRKHWNFCPPTVEPAVSHPTLTTATASSDSIVTVASSCSEVFGCARHSDSFSPNDNDASKNFGS